MISGKEAKLGLVELGGGEQGGLSPPPTWYPQGGEGYQVLAAPKC